MKRIYVSVKSERLCQKIRLALRGFAEITDESEGADLCITDATGLRNERIITVGGDRECDLHVPFSIEELLSLARERCTERAALSLLADERAVMFGGRKIKLTELEYGLLSVLMSKKGQSFGKEELLGRLWGEGVDLGVVNVYVHYLREKLEAGGEKVIISSRGAGYKINEKYLKEDTVC